MASLVGAIDNSIGLVGAAPGARIWSVKVTSGGSGKITNSALTCAIDWTTGHASTIDVANLSLGDFFDPKEPSDRGVSESTHVWEY